MSEDQPERSSSSLPGDAHGSGSRPRTDAENLAWAGASGLLSLRAYVSAQLNAIVVPVARRDANVPGSVGMVAPFDGGARDPNDPVFDGYDFGRWLDLEPDAGAPCARASAGRTRTAR